MLSQMNIRPNSAVRAMDLVMISICVLSQFFPAPAVQAGPPSPVVSAFYVKRLPDTYSAQEKFFASFRNTGINTLIMELPLTPDGYPDIDVVPNAVFLSHQAGIGLYVVLPTRTMPGPISDHDDWEDRKYDLNSDGYRRAGKLDLFNTAAVDYLASLARELASFSVDGLLLGTDLAYEPLEGMSRIAAKFASIKLDADIDPANMYKKLGKGPSGRFIQEYSDLFLKWAGLKRDRLVTVFDTIRTAARKANGSLRFGLAIPVVYPVTTPVEMLSLFAFDMDAYRRKDTDYFLASIEYRDLQEQLNLNYRQATELVTRVARSVFTAAKDGQKVIVVLPMTERLTGKYLRFSEIEEINGLIRNIGETGIGYVIKPDTELNPQFTSKLFKK